LFKVHCVGPLRLSLELGELLFDLLSIWLSHVDGVGSFDSSFVERVEVFFFFY